MTLAFTSFHYHGFPPDLQPLFNFRRGHFLLRVDGEFLPTRRFSGRLIPDPPVSTCARGGHLLSFRC